MKLRSTKSAKGASSPLSKQKVSQEARSPFRPVNLKDRVAPQPRDIPSTPTRKKIKVQDDSTPSKPFTGSPNTPNGPKTPRTPSSVLQGAKSAFRRCSTPAKLVGRELERKFLTDFVCKHLELCQGGSLYVSGLPGTGKTALLNEILLEMTERLKNAKALVIQVNCMNVSDPKHIFSKISSQLKLGSDDVLQDIFAPESASKSTPLYFVILDEIDHLISKDQDVLYKLFEWAKAPQSRLILVGIANALDLTSRFLPRLETKNGKEF